MDGIVDSCPLNLTSTQKASTRLGCGQDKYGNDQYMCLPNKEKTGLVELCHDGIMGISERGYCLETVEGKLSRRNCTDFLTGCPDVEFQMTDIYKYPACLRISTRHQCYLADPSCGNITRNTTTENTAEAFAFRSTTDHDYGIYNTTAMNGQTTALPEDDSIITGAIVGSLVAVVLTLTLLLIIAMVVWKRRKRQKMGNRKRRKMGNQFVFLEEEEIFLCAIPSRRTITGMHETKKMLPLRPTAPLRSRISTQEEESVFPDEPSSWRICMTEKAPSYPSFSEEAFDETICMTEKAPSYPSSSEEAFDETIGMTEKAPSYPSSSEEAFDETNIEDLQAGKRTNLNSENIEPENAKAYYEILERFQQKYAQLNIRRLYLGRYHQNENKIVIAVVFDCDAQTVMNANVTSFENHDVVFKRLKEARDETSKVEISDEAREWQLDHETAEKIEKEIFEKSRKLMETHSNLEIVSGSCVKSQKGGTNLLRTPCVVLYCSIKGIIPLEENAFPTNIGDFPVDVREGFFFPSPNGNTIYQDSPVYNNLRMGCNIGTEGVMHSGTLGGFVALENEDIGFITCAHVLHEKLPIPKGKLSLSFRVVQPENGISRGNNLCGEHIRSVCPFSKGPNAATVDAALVKVSPHRRPNNGLFANLTKEQVSKRGFDIDKPPTFHTGEIRDLRCPMQKEHRFQSCFKVGSQTGFTKGSLHLNCSTVRLVSGTLKHQPVSCSVYKLFEIKPESDHFFATQGDSGALVFQAITGTSADRFVCIGMIIGIADNNFCYVMPIKEVLKELRLPQVESLYSFEVPMEIDNAN